MRAEVFADGEPLKASPTKGVARTTLPPITAEKALGSKRDQVQPGVRRTQDQARRAKRARR